MIRNLGQEIKRQALYRISGVDATPIDARVETVEVVISEYGRDWGRFTTEKEFVSHATLAPCVPKSGGKPVKNKKRNCARSRVASVLRMAALSLRHRDTALASGRTIVTRPNGREATWRFSLLPGLTGHPDLPTPPLGANPTSTKEPRPTRTVIDSSV
jgi:hypothetical protein